MDPRPFNVDPRPNFLPQTFSIGCLALFYDWHVVISAVHVSDVYVRWQRVRCLPHDFGASHFCKFPIEKLCAVKAPEGGGNRSQAPVCAAFKPGASNLTKLVDLLMCATSSASSNAQFVFSRPFSLTQGVVTTSSYPPICTTYFHSCDMTGIFAIFVKAFRIFSPNSLWELDNLGSDMMPPFGFLKRGGGEQAPMH